MNLLKKLLFAGVLLAAGIQGASATSFDRGIQMNATVFVPKGQWMAGSNLSYSTFNNDDYKFLVVDNIDLTGYNFKVSPMVAYAFQDNMAIGLRGGYHRQLLKLDNVDLSLGEGMSFGVSDFYSLKHTVTGTVMHRYYIPLGESKRFALFNETQLSYGYSQSKVVNGSGAAVTGTYETSHDISLGCMPGLIAFVTNNAAVEVNVGVLGFGYTHSQQVTDQVYTGEYSAAQLDFKINLLSIALGIVFYI